MLTFLTIGGILFSVWALHPYPHDEAEDEANDYFPVQSDSERAAGHPLVGVS